MLTLFSLIFYLESAVAQIKEEWVAVYNAFTLGAARVCRIDVDATGNVYVAGSIVVSLSEYFIIKYDANGTQLWVSRYGGTEGTSSELAAMVVDPAGNVYATGSSAGDYATIKYDANGNELWVARYRGPYGGGPATAIAVDAAGNVYVTGAISGCYEGTDYATIKYDANGNEQWIARYNAPGDWYDSAQAIAVDTSGNVYVTGDSYEGGWRGKAGYATIKYDSNGNELWVARYNGPDILNDTPTSLAVDAVGNVYVTGYSQVPGDTSDYATIKYDDNGNEKWVARYNGKAHFEDPLSLVIDAAGNVYVAGSTKTDNGKDYTTIKYDNNGNEKWLAQYDGPGTSWDPMESNSDDIAESLAVDAEGNVYVTGSSLGSVGGYDYTTVKYDPGGNEMWVSRHNGLNDNNDFARALALDAAGNVYVTGGARDTPFLHATTIKLVQNSGDNNNGDGGDNNVVDSGKNGGGGGGCFITATLR